MGLCGQQQFLTMPLPERDPILFLQVLQAVFELLAQSPRALVTLQVGLHLVGQWKLWQLHVEMFTIIPVTTAMTLKAISGVKIVVVR